MNPNNTNYPVESTTLIQKIYEKFKKVEEGDTLEDRLKHTLKYYQYLTYTLMTSVDFGIGEYTRGLLVYHSMGLGKTFLAISIALVFVETRKVIIVASKSLHENFSSSIKKILTLMFPKLSEDEIKKKLDHYLRRFNFISMDAYNMFDQLNKLMTGSKRADTSLENTLIIVDEAHNLFRAIINSAADTTNAKKLYYSIMETKDIRLLFLTGTPCVKDPFEIVPCFNMLAGYALLPEHYNKFYKAYFNESERYKIEHGEKLKNRLLGFISYAHYSFPKEIGSSKSKNVFPVELPDKIEYIEMSSEQYQQYLSARKEEEYLVKKMSANAEKYNRVGDSVKQNLTLPQSEHKSTYYVRSRIISNYASSLERAKEGLNNLPNEEFTPINSPKITRILQNIEKSEGPVLIYSQFVSRGGLNTVARYLEIAKFKNVTEHINEDKYDISKIKNCYAIISGETPVPLRTTIQNIWNHESNMYGKIIKIILVSKTGAEGIDLKYGRQVHILEPYWHKSRENQVKSRIIRLGSHVDLPEKHRNVQTFLYISRPYKKLFEVMKDPIESVTIDESLHNDAIKRHESILAVRNLLKSVSIECSFYKSVGIEGIPECKICMPTNVKLFFEDPITDIQKPNPCQPYKKSKENVKKITHEGKTYYYKKSDKYLGYIIYSYDEKLDAIKSIPPNDPVYIQIVYLLAK